MVGCERTKVGSLGYWHSDCSKTPQPHFNQGHVWAFVDLHDWILFQFLQTNQSEKPRHLELFECSNLEPHPTEKSFISPCNWWLSRHVICMPCLVGICSIQDLLALGLKPLAILGGGILQHASVPKFRVELHHTHQSKNHHWTWLAYGMINTLLAVNRTPPKMLSFYLTITRLLTIAGYLGSLLAHPSP